MDPLTAADQVVVASEPTNPGANTEPNEWDICANTTCSKMKLSENVAYCEDHWPG